MRNSNNNKRNSNSGGRNRNGSDDNAKTTMPSSPFFRPSTAYPTTNQSQTTTVVRTPRGKNKRILSKASSSSSSDDGEAKSSIVGCTANMCTAIVGSGIVGLPYAIKETGFVAGIVLIILVGILAEKSLRLLINTAKHVHKQSYETAAEVAFGVVGFRFILIMEFVMSFGAMVTYLMITKDCACLLLGIPTTSTTTANDDDESNNNSGMIQNLVLLGVSLCTQFPLACLRDMAHLEKTSTIAVGIDCIIVAVVAYCSPWQQTIANLATATTTTINTTDNNGGGGEVSSSWWEVLLKHDTIKFDTLFVGLGVLSFAFECQESVFLIAGSLDNPTAQRWGTVTKLTIVLCLSLSVICGVTGYFGYQDETKGNILNNLPSSESTTFIAQSLLGITMLATYPLASFVARHVAVVLCFDGPRAHEGYDSSILSRPDRRILVTFVLYILAMIPATVLTDMGTVIAFAGVIGGSSLAYIGPGMLFLAVHGGRFLDITDSFFFKATHCTTTKESCDNNNNHNESTTVVGVPPSEMTSLTNHKNKSKSTISTKQFNGIVRAFLWYGGGFPIWCHVAEIGKKRVLNHAKELVAKPHVDHLRIGDIDLRGMENLLDKPSRDLYISPADIEEDEEKVRPSLHKSLSEQDGLVLIRPMKMRTDLNLSLNSNNSNVVKPIKKEKKKSPQSQSKSSTTILTLEPDPQEVPPNWIDFLISILYILFGCLAMVAGLASLLGSK